MACILPILAKLPVYCKISPCLKNIIRPYLLLWS